MFELLIMDKSVACEYWNSVLKNRAGYRSHKSKYHREMLEIYKILFYRTYAFYLCTRQLQRALSVMTYVPHVPHHFVP